MTHPQDINLHFHQELEGLEQVVLGVVDKAVGMVEMAVESVVTGKRIVFHPVAA